MWLPRNQIMQSQLKGTGQAPVPYKVDEASQVEETERTGCGHAAQQRASAASPQGKGSF